jgi:hypothetical protein
MRDLFVAWFMIDEPLSHPVLLYATERSASEDQSSLEVLERVYQGGKDMAKHYRIYRTIHIGTYLAYLSVLNTCIQGD